MTHAKRIESLEGRLERLQLAVLALLNDARNEHVQGLRIESDED